MAKIIKKKKAASSGAASAGYSMAKVPLETIVDNPEMKDIYRSLNEEHVNELVASITESGLDIPLIVSSTDQTTKIGDEEVPLNYVVAGRHRISALSKIAKKTPRAFAKLFPDGIPVMKREGSDLIGSVFAQLRENVDRQDPTPDQIFPALQFLASQKDLKQKDIAKRLGKTDGWVSQMLAINTALPDDLKEAVLDKSLPVRDAQKLASNIRKAEKTGDTAAKAAVEKQTEAARKKVVAAKKRAATNAPAKKRHSLKALYGAYQRLSKISMGTTVKVLENIIQYTLNDTDTLSQQISNIFQQEEKQAEQEKKEKLLAKKKVQEEKAKKKAALQKKRAAKKTAKKSAPKKKVAAKKTAPKKKLAKKAS